MRFQLPADPKLTPLHHQVYVVLRQQILEGAYSPDEAMPPEHELSRLFNVSRITVRRALDRLESERLVIRQRGRGTFALPAAVAMPFRTNLKGIFENLMEMGLKTKVRLVEFGYVPASPSVADELKIEVGAPVQKAVRVRSHKGTPFSHLTTYIPGEIGRTFDAAMLAEKPLLSLLEAAGCVVAEAEQTISSKLADTFVGPLLELEPGSALLWVRRTVFDQNDRPIERLHALYRPDIYEYQVRMSRVVDAKAMSLWSPQSIR